MVTATPGPCRFCTAPLAKSWHTSISADDETPWTIECANSDCNATGPRRATEAEAIDAWNASSPTQDLLVATLGAIADHFAAVMSGPMIAGRGVTFANGVEGIPTIKAARSVIARLEGRS